jgi:two-component system repressor protein LuxO
VGSGKEEKVDIRFISATNRDPQVAITEHKLREDLFYRLNVISIALPPLNERDNDIVQLAEYFLSHFSEIEGKVFAGFSSGAEKLVKSYLWPGNVRQLMNIIHSSTVMSEGPLITENIIVQQLGRQYKQVDSPSTIKTNSIASSNITSNQSTFGQSTPTSPSSIITLAEVEKVAIEQAIEMCHDNIVKAASELGVSPSTLYKKMQ